MTSTKTYPYPYNSPDTRPVLPTGWEYSSMDQNHVNVFRTTFRQTDHTPHWRTGTDGYITARIEACMHDAEKSQGGWLHIDTVEGYETDKGKDSKQRTMLTLTRADCEALYAGLAHMLGKKGV